MVREFLDQLNTAKSRGPDEISSVEEMLKIFVYSPLYPVQ